MNIARILQLSCLIGILTLATCYGQSVSERFIIKDSNDSTLLKAQSIKFDKAGKYCFQIKASNKVYFLYTKTDTLGPFTFIGGSYGAGGSVAYTQSEVDSKDSSWYYKNGNGVTIYGPIKGRVREYRDSDTKENIALTVTYKDSVYYYANNSLIHTLPIHKAGRIGIDHTDWCTFSTNGQSIYYTKQDSLYSIYVNSRLIDTSFIKYHEPRINNQGDFLFVKGQKVAFSGDRINQVYFVHSTDTVIGPLLSHGDRVLKANGGYYLSSRDYIIVNNTVYPKLERISHVIVLDKKNHLFGFQEDAVRKLNVNGKIYSHSFEKVFQPVLDTNGNFAFYGYKDYYLYKYVNGKEETIPITKYNVRPTPLYISPTGSSLHVFRTDDSTYIYRDDTLLFAPLSNSQNFIIKDSEELFPYTSFTERMANRRNHLSYIEIDTVGYMIYNGRLSKPMIPLNGSTYDRKTTVGGLAAIQSDDNGFILIQKIAEHTFLINVNNEVYQEVNNVEEIVEDGWFFDGKELIFYGIKDMAFYQYTLKL